MAEEIQKRFQKELDSFKSVEKEIHKLVSQRKLLDSQLNENKAVQTELELVATEAEVFKLVGPVLVRQARQEAALNVAKRMEYIGKELQRLDAALAALQTKQDSSRAALTRIEKDFQQAQVKAALKR